MSEDNGKPVPEQETVDEKESVDPEELESVKDLIQSLIKTAKTLKIYLPNNPIHQKHLQELTEKFSVHLKDFGSLVLGIQQFQLFFHDEPVYENTNRLESMAFKLYVDGMREIIFHEGLEQEEILNLLDALERDYDPSNPNDDMVTLLWEMHLAHVSYSISEEIFEEDDLVQQVQIPDDPNQAREQQTFLKKEIQKAAEEFEAEGAKRPNRPYSQVFQLNEEEIQHVKDLMVVEEKRDLRLEMITILGSILEIEGEDQAFEEAMIASRRVLGILIMQGDFVHSTKMLEVYRNLQTLSPALSSHHQSHLLQALNWAGEKENFQEIEKMLKVGNLEDTENFSKFLFLLTHSAIPSLIELLGNINQMKVRRLVCEALVALGRDDISGLVEGLRDSRWYVVRNLVYVLGKIRNPKAIDHFRRLTRHPELKVRKEILQAISLMPQEQIEGICLNFLKDPDDSIRQQAIRWLTSWDSQEGLKALQKMVSEEVFKEREFSEKKEVFESIAKIGKDQMVPYLDGFLGKKMRFWLSNAVQDELSLCAASALRRIGTEAALSVLQGGAESRNKVTREACKKALVGTNR